MRLASNPTHSEAAETRRVLSLRNRHRELFSSVQLYFTVFRMLYFEHYKQPVRAFVLDMFDLQLTADILAQFRDLDRSNPADDQSVYTNYQVDETLPFGADARTSGSKSMQDRPRLVTARSHLTAGSGLRHIPPARVVVTGFP